jgi:hypothetical protein
MAPLAVVLEFLGQGGVVAADLVAQLLADPQHNQVLGGPGLGQGMSGGIWSGLLAFSRSVRAVPHCPASCSAAGPVGGSDARLIAAVYSASFMPSLPW